MRAIVRYIGRHTISIAFIVCFAHALLGTRAAWRLELNRKIVRFHYLRAAKPDQIVPPAVWSQVRQRIVASGYSWRPPAGEPLMEFNTRQDQVCGIYSSDGALHFAVDYQTPGMGVNFASFLGVSNERQGPSIGGWVSRFGGQRGDYPLFEEGAALNARGFRCCMFVVSWNERAGLRRGIAVRWWFLVAVFVSILLSKPVIRAAKRSSGLVNRHLKVGFLIVWIFCFLNTIWAVRGRWWIDFWRDGTVYREPVSSFAPQWPRYQEFDYRLTGIYSNDRALIVVYNLDYQRSAMVAPTDPVPAVFGRPLIGYGYRRDDSAMTTACLPNCYDLDRKNVYAITVICPWSGKFGIAVRWWFLWAALSALVTGRYGIKYAARIMRARIDPGICRRCGYDLRATPNRCPECGTVAPAP